MDNVHVNMYVQTATGSIVHVNISKFINDEELHSFIWKLKYDITFTKNEDFMKKYVENVF